MNITDKNKMVTGMSGIVFTCRFA